MSVLSFVIVGPQDHPIYEADLISPKDQQAQYLHQFVLHAALDAVDEAMWSSKDLYLKLTLWDFLLSSLHATHGAWHVEVVYTIPATPANTAPSMAGPGMHSSRGIMHVTAWCPMQTVDRFNALSVAGYVTPGCARFLLLHDGRNADSIKSFFTEVHELYIKVVLNPLRAATARISSREFDRRVRVLAKRVFG